MEREELEDDFIQTLEHKRMKSVEHWLKWSQVLLGFKIYGLNTFL